MADDESLRESLHSSYTSSRADGPLEGFLVAPPRAELERLLGFSLDPATYERIRKQQAAASEESEQVTGDEATEEDAGGRGEMPPPKVNAPAPSEPASRMAEAVGTGPVDEALVSVEPELPVPDGVTGALAPVDTPKKAAFLALSPGSPEPWCVHACVCVCRLERLRHARACTAAQAVVCCMFVFSLNQILRSLSASSLHLRVSPRNRQLVVWLLSLPA